MGKRERESGGCVVAKDEWFENAMKSDTWQVLVTVFIFAYIIISFSHRICYYLFCYVNLLLQRDGTVTHNNIFGMRGKESLT